MGLFSKDRPNEPVQALVENARHESVSTELLTETSTGFLGGHDYLSEEPLVEHLDEAEQPHFIFPITSGGAVQVEKGEDLEPGKKFRNMVTITDARILFVVGDESGDREEEISYSAVTGAALDKVDESESSLIDMPKYVLTVETIDNVYEISQSDLDPRENLVKKFREAGEYVAERTERQE